MTAQFQVYCTFDECSNEIAYDQQEIDNTLYPYQQINRIEGGTYLVFKDPLVIDLQPIYSYCYKQDKVYRLIQGTVIDPDGNASILTTEEEMISYGLSFSYETEEDVETSKLTAQIDEESLYDYTFDLILHATVEQEPEWFNVTYVKINYEKPPCEVYQDQIDSTAGTSLQLQLSVVRGMTADMTQSYSDFVALAEQAFRIQERTFCGEMAYKFENVDNGPILQEFLQVD